MTDIKTTAMDASRALSLLSNMYLCKPTRESIICWKSVLADDASIFLKELKRALYAIDVTSEETIENLVWEFTRLFIGPYKLPCPPWESVYTSPKRLMMQEAADQVRQLYAEAGVKLDAPDIMPDHIGVELNFLALLLQESHSERVGEERLTELTDDFLKNHVLKWIPKFSRDMEISSETRFYKTLARVTRSLVEFIGR